MSAAVAKRYAKALISVASTETELALFETHLEWLAQSYQKSALRDFLENPSFQVTERLDFVKNFDLDPKIMRCLELLIKGHRTSILPNLSKAYRKELDAKLCRVRAEVTTARPLLAAQLEAIGQALSNRLGKTVILETELNPRVLGGVRAQIGGLIFDSTLESQFSQLRRALCN